MQSTSDVEYAKLLRMIRKLRKDNQITQARLARCVGKKQSAWSKIERGELKLELMDYLRVMMELEADPIVPLRAAVRRLSK